MIVKLERQNEQLWLYGIFERRIKDFVEKYAEKNIDCPVDAILHEMFNRWLNQPALAGYYLALDENGAPIGHLASWIVNYYGQNRLYIWQVEMDEGNDCLVPMIDALREWITSINEKVPEPMQVRRLEWLTWHPEPVWRRYLTKTGLTVMQHHSIIEASF